MSKCSLGLATALMMGCLAQAQTVYVVQYHVRVTGTEADIHTAPSTLSEVVVQAQEGEIFGVFGTQGEWYIIDMFTLPPRYLHQSLAEKTEKPKFQVSRAVRKNACLEIDEVQRQAEEEGYERLVRGEFADNLAWATHVRLINDRYQLPIYRKYGISPALADELNCYNLLHRASEILGLVYFVLSGTAPFVLIGGLISAVVILYRRGKSNAGMAPVNGRVLWRTIVYGTLMSALVFVVGVPIVYWMMIPIPFAGGMWKLYVIMGILGLLTVGCYILALHIAREQSAQQKLT